MTTLRRFKVLLVSLLERTLFHISLPARTYKFCNSSIVQAIATVISGSVLGLVFAWKLGLVAFACTPLLVSTGYIRLVSTLSSLDTSLCLCLFSELLS